MGSTGRSIGRMQPADLHAQIAAGHAPLLLDVRRREAFRRRPAGIPGAVPVTLDDPESSVPDIARESPIVTYCLCSGMASSARVALWLEAAGYRHLRVLDGGLPAWESLGLPLAPLQDAAAIPRWMPAAMLRAAGGAQLIAEAALLAGRPLPLRREMAVLFVDMVDSTSLLLRLSPEEMLALVQAFMQTVVEVSVQHCGDVHDFQGDGAMLYFAGPGEAVPAAFRLRRALAIRRAELPLLPDARMALDFGPLLVGRVGTSDRRSLSFIGPSIHIAARILPLAPPGGIVATQRIVQDARSTDPDLAARFTPLPGAHSLKGFRTPLTVFVAPPDPAS
jgi:class 3 adenylate cyclase